MAIALICIGALLFCNGAIMCILANLNLGVVLTVLVGVFFLAWGIFYKKVRMWTKKGILKTVKNFVVVLLCAEVLLVGFIAVYGQYDTANYKEDAVIILGAGVHGDRVSVPLQLRLDTAVRYHRKNPDALLVVTGGQGFQETVTEASAMEKYLLSRGVAADKIVKEEHATSTEENMRFSKEILDVRLGSDYEIVVITNNFHIYRSASIAKMVGFEKPAHLHAGLQWYNLVPCYLRESLAVLKMWVFPNV